MAKNTTMEQDGKQSVWLKLKTVKRRNGETKEVFQGSFDLGGGRMVKIQLDARLYTVEKDDNVLVPVYVSKWKSDRPQKTKSYGQSWK